MTKKNRFNLFWGEPRSSSIKIQDSKPAKVLRGKTFKLLFLPVFLNFPHNITIFALRYNKKANIR